MSTPEGFVKDAVKRVLAHHGLPYNMFVSNGMGDTFVDFLTIIPVQVHAPFIGVVGMTTLIETKRADRLTVQGHLRKSDEPTQRQLGVLREFGACGAATFVVYSDQTLAELDGYINKYTQRGLCGTRIGQKRESSKNLVRE